MYSKLINYVVFALLFIPSDSKGTNSFEISEKSFSEITAMPNNVNVLTDDDYEPVNYEGRDDIAWKGDIAVKLSFKGRVLIIEELDENGKPINKGATPLPKTIIKLMCYDDVYIVMDELDGEGYSKLPYVGLYKLDLLKNTCEFLDSANYIEFDRKAGKIKLRTASGLAGDCEADGFKWEEKVIDLNN